MVRRIRSEAERIWRRDKRGEWVKPTSTHGYPLIRLFLVGAIFLLFIFWFWHQISAASALHIKDVDPSYCQGPASNPNPPESCYPNDVCDPTRIKIDGGKCVDTPRIEIHLTPEIPMSQNIEMQTEVEISGDLK